MDLVQGSARRIVQRRWKFDCRSRSRSSTAQGVEGLSVDVLPRIGAAHLEGDAAHADADQGADLEQLKAEGIDLGLSPLGPFESQSPQGFDEGVGQRREEIQRWINDGHRGPCQTTVSANW
jgi:hypothetical protein